MIPVLSPAVSWGPLSARDARLCVLAGRSTAAHFLLGRGGRSHCVLSSEAAQKKCSAFKGITR